MFYQFTNRSLKLIKPCFYNVNVLIEKVKNWINSKEHILIYEDDSGFECITFSKKLFNKQNYFKNLDKEFEDYLIQNHKLPIYVITKNKECNFKQLATDKINFWERFLLIKQALKQAHNKDNLAVCERKKYLKFNTIIKLNTSEKLIDFLKYLNFKPNVIAGIYSFELETALRMYYKVKTSNDLVFCVTNDTKNNSINIIGIDSGKLLIQRNAYCSTTKEIITEIEETLKFLSRKGYKEDQPFSVLINEKMLEKGSFKKNDSMEIISIKEEVFSNKLIPDELRFNFCNKYIRESFLAYIIPKILKKYIIFFSFFLIVVGMFTKTILNKEKIENKKLEIEYYEINNKLPKNSSTQIKMGELFKEYVNKNYNNPSRKIKSIHNILKGQIPAEYIIWKSANNDYKKFEIKLKFTAQFKDKFLTLKKILHTKRQLIAKEADINLLDNSNELILIIQGKDEN